MSGRIYTPDKVYVLHKNGIPYAAVATQRLAVFLSNIDGGGWSLVPFTRQDEVDRWWDDNKKSPATYDSLFKGPYNFNKITRKYYR